MEIATDDKEILGLKVEDTHIPSEATFIRPTSLVLEKPFSPIDSHFPATVVDSTSWRQKSPAPLA